MSHPDKLPDLFLDRSLGRVKVPALLRADGLRLITLAEYYGIPADEDVADEHWLELAGSRGWVVFMKDTRIHYNEAERLAVKAHSVQAFCLSNQNLTAEDMAKRFIHNIKAIEEAAAEAGPFIYAVQQNRIDSLNRDCGPVDHARSLRLCVHRLECLGQRVDGSIDTLLSPWLRFLVGFRGDEAHQLVEVVGIG